MIKACSSAETRSQPHVSAKRPRSPAEAAKWNPAEFSWKEEIITLCPCLRVRVDPKLLSDGQLLQTAHNTVTSGSAHRGHEEIRERAKTPLRGVWEHQPLCGKTVKNTQSLFSYIVLTCFLSFELSFNLCEEFATALTPSGQLSQLHKALTYIKGVIAVLAGDVRVKHWQLSSPHKW